MVAPGGTGQGGAGFSLLHGRAGRGPTHHHGPCHHHDAAVDRYLRGRGFLSHPQDPLPHQDEDPPLEQLGPYGELGCGGGGGASPQGARAAQGVPAHRRWGAAVCQARISPRLCLWSAASGCGSRAP